MRATDRMALAVAVAMIFASWSFTPLTSDRSVVWLGAGVVAGLQLVSLLGRRVGLSGWLVHLVQFALLAAGVVWLGLAWAPAAPPEIDSLTRLGRFYLDAVVQVRTQVAPMTPSRSVRWIALLLLGVFTILADMLAITLISPSWVLAPVVGLYLVPALALRSDISWAPFVALAIGYLVVLAAEGINENAGWTRNLSGDSAERSHSPAEALRLAALVGVPAVVASLLLGTLLPLTGSLDIQSARPKGSGPLQMEDPTIDLSRNLNLPVDRVVLRYQTTEERGLYLRTASLTKMDAEGWKMTPVSLADGKLPAAPGLTQRGKPVSATVQIADLGGEYLPAPYSPTNFDAEGQWRFDPVSLAILSTRDENRRDAIRNLDYQVEAVLSDPIAENFTVAQPGTPPDADETAVVPPDVPQQILQITHEVTREATTPVLKAAAIQAYLADPNNFAYSTTAPQGDGYQVLVNFLTKDKAGYCTHFASAMALMARIEGIPSRVSVGFLPGTKKGNDWEVLASNMHAWPELYFAGYGWVRFEPTSRVAAAPEWTLVSPGIQPLPSDSPSAGNSEGPIEPSASPTPTPSASASPQPGTETAAGSSFPWGRVLRVLAIVGGIALLVSLPALVRLARRRRNLAVEGSVVDRVEGAWTEVRDTVRDLRLGWPEGTPREKTAALAPELGEVGEHAAGSIEQPLAGLALLVERGRYARSLSELDVEPAAAARAVRGQLLADRSLGTKLRAFFWPSSLGAALRERLAADRAARRQSRTGGATAAAPDEPSQADAALFGPDRPEPEGASRTDDERG